MRHSDLVLLGLLADGPRHGYQLNRQIEEMRIRSWARISQATVYRGLDRLEGDGCLETERERAGSRPERTVYRLTPAGKERLEKLVGEALSSEEPLYSDRLVGAAFSTVALSGDVRRELLESAVEEAEERKRRLPQASEDGTSALGEAIVDFYRRVTDAEARLLRAVRSLGGSRG